ncbi:MAG: methyltransferase [Agarilytica sp.]
MSVFQALATLNQNILNTAGAQKASDNLTLVIADENIEIAEISALASHCQCFVLTNRKDLALACGVEHIPVAFTDFEFNAISAFFDNKTEPNFNTIIYRVSKERVLVHHIFNNISPLMHENTRLLIGGKKNEGIKGYHQKLLKHFHYSGTLIKDGDRYTSVLKPSTHPSDIQPQLLDDKDYASVREIEGKSTTGKNNTIRFASKPGLYGWDKIDQGSTFLIETLFSHFKEHTNVYTFESLLDLGCGYGYLSLSIAGAIKAKSEAVNNLKNICATDNNAAALRCCELNLTRALEEHCVDFEVVADDCAASIKKRFDLILCNPPFHMGFEQTPGLSEKFCSSIAKHLLPQGSAFVVVNSFIPFERLAKLRFSNIKLLANNNQFKVLELRL